MRRWQRLSGLLILLGVNGLAPSSLFAGGGALVFTDVTSAIDGGLPATLTESLAWGDYDDDGDQDLYLTNMGANVLFRNDGDGSFTDVTAEAGVGHPGFSVGTAFGDLDNDGDLDLYVVTFGAADVLYRNEGDGTFTDVTAGAGLTSPTSRGMAYIDYDGDSLLDIYINAIGPDVLYHNLGDLQFEDVAPELGLGADNTGVGVVCTDVDDNGWVDIFTGNRSGDLSNLFLNTEGTLVDIVLLGGTGIDSTGLGMGVLAFDYDNDLDMDLYWTTWPTAVNALYENQGDGTFYVDVASASGTEDPLGWGISCNAGDIDNDGWQDFFVTNGFSDTSSKNVLFRNRGDGTFEDVSDVLGDLLFDGRGVAFADFDLDGDLDLCVTADAGAPTRLYRNDTVSDRHWITFDLEGTVSNRSAIGARIEVTAAGNTIVDEVSGGAGRGSSNSLPVEFGLGDATTVEQVRIRWPSGCVQFLIDLEIDQVHAVIEACGTSDFIRGDVDGDGAVGIGDAIADLEALFGAGTVSCPAASDANGDQTRDIADPVYNLTFMFLMGPQPPAPFPDCGSGSGPLPCPLFDACP